MPTSEETTNGPAPGARPRTASDRWSWLRPHAWFAGSAAVVVVLFAAILTQGSGDLLEDEVFSDFYDHQAASLLQGRLDVPFEAISLEAFWYQGKYYGYFGLTPALLRIPMVALGVGFGHVSRAWMLAYFASLLIAGYLLLLESGRRSADGPWVPSRWSTLLFVANAGIANTAFFLGSRAYVFHEAILCGVAFALWSVWATLRHLREPGSRWWLGALVTGTLSLHARPPTGLFALTVLGLAAAWLACQRRREPGFAWHGLVALFAGLGIASFNGVSYLKFGTVEGCPLRLNVQYDPARLAKIEGRQFHASNLPFSADAYLFRPHADISPYFPYVRPQGPDPKRFPGAKIDMSEPILGLPFAMPGLVVLAVLGLASLRGREAGNRAAGLLPWLGIIPMGLSMFAAIAVSHRYTADFVPFLIAAAAPGCVWLGRGSSRLAPALRLAAVTATVVAVPVTLALTLHHQGEGVWGVPDHVRTRYLGLRRTIDGWFGVAHPYGYDLRILRIREADVNILGLLAQVSSSVPAKRPEAARYYRQIALIKPEDPLAHARLGDALIALRNLPEAVAAYETAVRLGPGLAFARHNLGTAYLEQKRVPEAVAQFEAALRIDPNYDASRQTLRSLGLRPPANR